MNSIGNNMVVSFIQYQLLDDYPPNKRADQIPTAAAFTNIRSSESSFPLGSIGFDRS
jgi:hypothetical protein